MPRDESHRRKEGRGVTKAAFLATAFLAALPLHAHAVQGTASGVPAGVSPGVSPGMPPGTPLGTPQVEILDYGVFVVAEDHGEIPGSRETTLSGISRTSPFKFIRRTDQIPARPALGQRRRLRFPVWA
jgi:hypothetical protein